MNISNELSKNKEDFLVSIFLISLPIIFLTGSSVINSSIIIIDIYFLYVLFINKDFKYLNNKYFYSLIAFWVYLIINLFFSINYVDSLPRSVGLLRFIIFAFAINYIFNLKSNIIKKTILNCWTFIFLFISVDLIFEFIFGYNLFGFKSPFDGRLGGVMGEELKIGHFYSAFVLIILLNLNNIIKKDFNNKYIFYLIIFLFLLVSLMIGERSNFIKTFFIVLFFIFIFEKKDFLKKILFLFFVAISFYILMMNNAKIKDRIFERFLEPLLKNPVELVFNSKYGSHYKVAILVYENNKLFGVGLKNYRLETTKKKYPREDASIHPHQIHFEIISELGLIGYVLFISVFFFILFQSVKLYLKKKDSLRLCGILFIIISLIPLLPSGSFFTTYSAALFWFNLSFVLPKNT